MLFLHQNRLALMRRSNKEYIYDIVFKLFLSKPYEAVTIQDIETATGMTRGAVFYYAKNKEELFKHVVDLYFFKAQSLNDKLDLIKRDSENLLDFIHLYVQAVDRRMSLLQSLLGYEKAEASRAYLSFILQAQLYYPGFNEKMNDICDEELDIWESVLLSAQESQEIKSDVDIKSMSRYFRYFYVGMCYLTSLKNGVNIAELEYNFMKIYAMIKK